MENLEVPKTGFVTAKRDVADVRFGSKADFDTQISMSALPPKADIRWLG